MHVPNLVWSHLLDHNYCINEKGDWIPGCSILVLHTPSFSKLLTFFSHRSWWWYKLLVLMNIRNLRCGSQLTYYFFPTLILKSLHLWGITLFSCKVVCSILYLASDVGLYYLTFMGRNVRNRKNLMLVWIIIMLWIVLVFSMLVLLWIILSKNNTGMNSVSCE